MSKLSCFLPAALLVGGHVLAADSPPATPATPATAATSPSADLEAQLAMARQKLEAAARDVAQLSAQLGQSAMTRVQSMVGTRAVLGLTLDNEPAAKDQGATIAGVSPGGPAAEAGLAKGDVIVALNGAPTVGPNGSREVVELMGSVKPDTKVTVKVMRDGKPKEFQVTARASVANLFYRFNGPVQWVPGPGGPGGPGGPNPPWQQLEIRSDLGGVGGGIFEGMEVADISPALGQYFGTSQGVLVVRVPRAGEFLKLQDGDVILSIDGRVPENSSHATRILHSYQAGEKIQLKIMRQKKSMQLDATLPEQRGFGPRGRPPGDHPPTDQ
jgi:S1-C subfamily serine protease